MGKEEEPKPSVAMILGTDAYRAGLEPASLKDTYDLAESMAQIHFCGVATMAEGAARIMTGRSLGLSAMQSLRGVYVVHGRPGIDASLMQALCLQQTSICEDFSFVPEESDETQATFTTTRRGKAPQKYTFTIEDARKLGVLDKKGDIWHKDPKAMLRARAKSVLARLVYPDILFGMYSREELESGFEVDEPIPFRPTEMDGEIVTDPEVLYECVVSAAERDYAAEADALIEQIKVASTREEKTAVRNAIRNWDGKDLSEGKRVQAAYNETKGAK